MAAFSAGSLGGGGIRNLLAEVSAVNPNEGIYKVKVTDFPALKNVDGSILLKVVGMPTTFPNLVLTRTAEDTFASVSSVCTHEGCIVSVFSSSLKAMVCPCHGSRFTATGAVINGPAVLPLPSFRTSFDGLNLISIVIPGLAYTVQISRLPDSPRLQLTFKTEAGLKYEIRFRRALEVGDWVQLPFATSPTSGIGLTVTNGSGGNKSLYIDPPAATGFYSIIRY